VRTNQAKAGFDKLTISPLAVAKRVACFLPRRSDAFERRGTSPCGRACHAILFTHGPIKRNDYKKARAVARVASSHEIHILQLESTCEKTVQQ